MTRHTLALSTLLLFAACDSKTAPDTTACDASADSDGDGLDDCTEVETLGTDPQRADTDGDGFSDSDELDCVSDPLDGDEQCYACGWKHSDPGTLTSTGAEEGDTIENLSLLDQCGEQVDLWDFAGGYHILFMTASWCGVCKAEAREQPDRKSAFIDETGLDFSYLIVLAENNFSLPPSADDATAYADYLDTAEPVTASPDQRIIDATPWTGSPLPGKCVLSPEMELLYCYTGEGDEEAFEVIRQHAASAGR